MQKKFSFFGSQDLFFAHMLMMMLALDHGLLGLMLSTLMKVSFAAPPCPQVSLSLLNKHTHTQTNSCLHAQNHPQFSHIFLHQIMVNNWEQLSNKVCGIAEKACLKGLCWYAIILSDLGGSSLKDFHVLLKKKKKKKVLFFMHMFVLK